MSAPATQYNPFTSGDLFEPAYDPNAIVILNPGEIECKACATRLDTPAQEELQAHAKERKLCAGQWTSCGEFWAAAHA